MPGMFDYEDHDLALPDIDPEAVAHGPLTDEDWDEQAQTALRDLESAYGLTAGTYGLDHEYGPTHYEGGTYEL